VVEGRVRGLDRIEVRYYDDPARIEPIAFPEASYRAGSATIPNGRWTSCACPMNRWSARRTVYDYNVATAQPETLKVQEIPSGYDAALYATERLEIAARDGTMIPVSVVYRKDRDPGGPLHLYGYGAYGIAIEPGFSTIAAQPGRSRLCLCHRAYPRRR
jgi:oligopeptidase B